MANQLLERDPKTLGVSEEISLMREENAAS